MWVIFLLSTFCFGVVALGLIWIGNKVLNSIKRDNYNTEKEIEHDNLNERK